MKYTKRFAALVLAMMMAFSIMAVTAAAYDGADGHVHEACCENEIEPRVAAITCPECGGNAYLHKEIYHGTQVEWFECKCGWQSN